MKRSLSKITLLFALACVSLLAYGQNNPSQTPSVDFGRTTVQLNTSFVNSIQGLGAVFTDLGGNPLQNNTFTVRATGGSIDLTNAAGEIEHAGGLLINTPGAIIRIQNFTIDTSNPGAPVMSAAFIVNDHFAGRIVLFNVQPPATLIVPLQPQAGVLQVNGLALSLSAAGASAINGIFGGPVVQQGTAIGIANAYIVFAAAN